MKKQIAQLSKAEREKVEAEYHRMQPGEFDELMSRAKPRRANAINGSAARSRSKRKNKSTEKSARPKTP